MPPVVNSLVAGTLIEAARDLHPTFDPRRHPPLVLLRALSRYQQQLVNRIVRATTSFLTAVQETALPLADFDAGIVLPDYKYPAGVEVEGATTVNEVTPIYPVELIPWEDRRRYHLAAYTRNNVLYLTGSATDWVGFTTVRFYYVAEVDALTGLTGTLVLPNAAEACLVGFLASFMAQRGSQDPSLEAADRREFRAIWREAEEEFLQEMEQHSHAVVSVVRETF